MGVWGRGGTWGRADRLDCHHPMETDIVIIAIAEHDAAHELKSTSGKDRFVVGVERADRMCGPIWFVFHAGQAARFAFASGSGIPLWMIAITGCCWRVRVDLLS